MTSLGPCRTSQPEKISLRLSKHWMIKLNVMKIDNKENIMTSLKTLPHKDDGDFWEKFNV